MRQRIADSGIGEGRDTPDAVTTGEHAHRLQARQCRRDAHAVFRAQGPQHRLGERAVQQHQLQEHQLIARRLGKLRQAQLLPGRDPEVGFCVRTGFLLPVGRSTQRFGPDGAGHPRITARGGCRSGQKGRAATTDLVVRRPQYPGAVRLAGRARRLRAQPALQAIRIEGLHCQRLREGGCGVDGEGEITPGPAGAGGDGGHLPVEQAAQQVTRRPQARGCPHEHALEPGQNRGVAVEGDQGRHGGIRLG